MNENTTEDENIRPSLSSSLPKSRGKIAVQKPDRYAKSDEISDLLKEAENLLSEVGIPLERLGERRRSRTAMALLALLGIKRDFSELKRTELPSALSSRGVLHFWNDYFEENLKDSSYDDVRSENLDLLVLGNLAHNLGDKNGGATNDSRRAFGINAEFLQLMKHYRTESWEDGLKEFQQNNKTLREEFERNRNLHKITITLPSGIEFSTTGDKHNFLQKEIIEKFLPRFAKACEFLYFGDASKRTLFINKEKLEEIGFFEIGHEELPDIIVFDEARNWLYMIEAYHSTGEWDEKRVLKIKRKLPKLINSLVFVTAFLDRASFRTKASSIAWESEVWIASDPDHMIHFNGDKFSGPHQ